MSKALVFGSAALVFLAAGASAADLVAPGYGYAAPVYVAPAPIVYAVPRVYPAPQPYTAPPVTTGYDAPHSVPPEPIYDYAPGYGYDYTAPGFWNRSYWGSGYGFAWR